MLTRRELLAGAAIAASASSDAVARTLRSASRPNILFILADDLGWGDLSCYGRPDFETPVLDDLAARGVRLTQAYANSSTCSPTRVALITGRYQNRLPVGLYDPIIPGNVGLPPEHPTLPSLLRNAGYTTALVGKWHLGWLPEFGPLKSGYDEFFGLFSGAMTYFTHKTGHRFGPPAEDGLFEGDAPVEREGYATDLFTDRAVEFIRRDHAKPFFLSLHYTSPHWPWEGPGDEARASGIREMGHYEGGSPATFREMVQSMDQGIGRVLAALAASGRAKDTLVIFTSDNGGERYSHHFPLRGEKGLLWEGGIRVPAIAVWPGVLPSGRVTSQVAMTMDWMPTLLGFAGAEPHPDFPPDGVDLGPVLNGRAAEFERTVFWRIHDMGAARRGEWKYVRWENQASLHNLTEDVTENANARLRNKEIFAQLERAFEEWDSRMLPVPPDARRGPWEALNKRGRTLSDVKE